MVPSNDLLFVRLPPRCCSVPNEVVRRIIANSPTVSLASSSIEGPSIVGGDIDRLGDLRVPSLTTAVVLLVDVPPLLVWLNMGKADFDGFLRDPQPDGDDDVLNVSSIIAFDLCRGTAVLVVVVTDDDGDDDEGVV